MAMKIIENLSNFPRPDMARRGFISLNGRWKFEFDPRDRGIAGGWNEKPEFSR